MKKLKSFLKLFRNFYLLVGVLALAWMLFFDRYNLLSQYKLYQRVNQLETDLEFYEKEKERIAETSQLMTNDPVALERYARERHWMKKDDEDLFIVVKK